MANLSPLEALSLTGMSEKNRIMKLATLCRNGRLGYENTNRLRAKNARQIISQIREPWGNRGKAAEALRKEFNRQRALVAKRERDRKIYVNRQARRFDKIAGHLAEQPYCVEARKTRVAFKRLGLLGRRPPRLLPKGNNWSVCYVPNCGVRDVSLADGNVLLLVSPDSVVTSQGANLMCHKIKYVVYRVGEVVGSVRVSHHAHDLASAIDSLKSRSVREAEAKGFDIQLDWVEGGFYTKSPKRRKARLRPFKRHTRDRN